MRPPADGAATILIASLLACESSGTQPDAESEHVAVYLEDGIQLCAGQLDAYEEYLDNVFALWTGGAPGGFHVNVHIRNEDCAGESRGCATDKDAWVGDVMGQYHEIAHVVHFQTDGSSYPSLEEGVAESLGPVMPLADEPATLASTDANILFVRSRDEVNYALSAEFTRFVVDEHGADAYREYFRTVGAIKDALPADFRNAYQAATGSTLDDTWSEFISAPRCAYDFWYCDAAQEINLPYTLNAIDCKDTDTIGFLSEDPTEKRFAPLLVLNAEALNSRGVVLRIENAAVLTGRCGDCMQQTRGAFLSSEQEIAVPHMLAAGSNVFVVALTPGASSSFAIDLAE